MEHCQILTGLPIDLRLRFEIEGANFGLKSAASPEMRGSDDGRALQ
jgi:hypothetical protein